MNDYFENILNLLPSETKTIDIITCNMTEQDIFKIKKYEETYNITIRYSIDLTGHSNAMGNWILESHNISIKNLYFNENIDNWKHNLFFPEGSKFVNGTIIGPNSDYSTHYLTLVDSDISGVDLSGSNISTATFDNVKAVHIIYNSSTILPPGYWFHTTSLIGNGINFSGVDLSSASFSGMSLSNLYHDDQTILPSGHIIANGYMIGPDINLTNADLTGANLTGANLTNANMTNANLTGIDLTGINLTGAYFTGVNLTNANLTNVNLTGFNLTNANLTNANLTGIDLTGINLTGADFTGVNLTNANLTNVNLTNLTNANLTNANLTNANLTASNLTGFNLTNANLTSANLTNTNLTNTNLTNVNLTGADLTNTVLTDVTSSGITPSDGNGVTLSSDFQIVDGVISKVDKVRLPDNTLIPSKIDITTNLTNKIILGSQDLITLANVNVESISNTIFINCIFLESEAHLLANKSVALIECTTQ